MKITGSKLHRNDVVKLYILKTKLFENGIQQRTQNYHKTPIETERDTLNTPCNLILMT